MNRFAVVACLIGFAVAGCSEDTNEPGTPAGEGSLRTVGINGAQLLPDGRLVANLNVCNAGENTVEVSESGDEVLVTARTDGPVAGDECSDGITVPLNDPLGDRDVVDGTTGELIAVHQNEG